jgi:hypothetical protein
VKPSELLSLLLDCYRERLAMIQRHEAVARHVLDYNANNAYQYVINREETHLAWLREAIEEQGGTVSDAAPAAVTPGSGKDAWRELAAEDAAEAQAFVERWVPKVETLGHARNRTMLQLMLGEVREQARFFTQAADARPDLLGKNLDGSPTRGVVAESRWLGD